MPMMPDWLLGFIAWFANGAARTVQPVIPYITTIGDALGMFMTWCMSVVVSVFTWLFSFDGLMEKVFSLIDGLIRFIGQQLGDNWETNIQSGWYDSWQPGGFLDAVFVIVRWIADQFTDQTFFFACFKGMVVWWVCMSTVRIVFWVKGHVWSSSQ